MKQYGYRTVVYGKANFPQLNDGDFRRVIRLKNWRILAWAIAVAIGVLVLRTTFHSLAGKSGLIPFADTAAVLTGAALVMGLILSGVLSDYKEGEKLPTAVAGNFAAIEDYAVRALRVVDLDASWVHARMAPVAHAIDDWFFSRKTLDELLAVYFENLNPVIDEVAKSSATVPGGFVTIPYMQGVHTAYDNLLGALNRVSVIRNTDYLPAAYVLLQTLVAVTLGLMVVADLPAGIETYLVPAAVSVVYVYMLLLIRDVDNPFDYGPGSSGVVEVPLDPWTKVYTSFSAS